MKILATVFDSVIKNKATFIAPLLFIVFSIVAKALVMNDTENPVSFHAAIERPGYEPAPAFYEVGLSASQAWEMTHETKLGKSLSTVASVFFWAAIVLLVLAGLDLLKIKESLQVYPVLLCLLFWLLLKYGAHSSTVANVTVKVSEAEYKAAKESPEGLSVLFKNKSPL